MKKQILIYGDYVEIKGVVEDCFFIESPLLSILDATAGEHDIQEAIDWYKSNDIELKIFSVDIAKTSKHCVLKGDLINKIKQMRKFLKHHEKVKGGYDIWVDMDEVFTVSFGNENLGTAKSESEAHAIISAHKQKKPKR